MPPGPGFLLAYDLLLNAERRASQGHYDDAIARIYRALEMYGQFCLRTANPRLTSENLNVELLPEIHRKYYETKRDPRTGVVQIGLKDNYETLCFINHPIAPIWDKWRNKLIDKALTKRNYSYLAHGMKPLSKMDYLEVKEVTWNFIMQCDEAMEFKQGLKDAKQLPQEI
jgi:CRISPR-associated protein (TIGR02710 family)